MKNFKLTHLLFIIASSLLLLNCTTEPLYPEGPAGADGIDGVDGTNGINGATGTTECAACHNIEKSETTHASYLFSKHSIETKAVWAGDVPISTYANRGSCTQCHTNQGYQDYAMTGTVTGEPYPDAVQKISCKTCHDKHTTFDFEKEGYDYALRLIAPVKLIADATYTIDYQGTSNNCALCHQPRRSPPIADQDGNFTVSNSHWGPHHGPQSTFLEGIQGAEIVGSLDYPVPATATHRTGASCTSCHMGETSGANDGNHTWVPTKTACTECHPSGAPDGVNGLSDDLAILHQLLEDVGILNGGHPHEGTYKISEAEAAWNYLLITEDNSNGTHNPAYARALVKNSIEALTAN